MDLSHPSLQHEAPLVFMLEGQDPASMSAEQLTLYISEMRLLRSSAQTQKAAVKGKAPQASRLQQTLSRFLISPIKPKTEPT